MVVLLPNCVLGVRHLLVDEDRDDYGERVPLGWGGVAGGLLLDGRRNEQADGMWALAVDPSVWPVRQDDLIIATDGATWLVDTSDLIQNAYDDYVDYVRLTARLRTMGGTQPGDSWFVARFTPGLGDLPDPADTVLLQPGLWTGTGPPPSTPFGAEPGDEYLDLVTGIIYRLEP